MDGGDHTAEVRVLGPIEVVIGGRVIEIGSAKQLTLLAALALDAGAVVATERLVDLLWGDDPPPTAHPTLRGLVVRLRKALAGDGKESVAWLRGRGSGYVLELGADQVDATRFERLSATGRDALARFDAPAAADALRAGLALWRGPALGTLSGSPAFSAEARRLDEARLGATEDLAEAELLLGRPGDALARLEPHVDANPLRERAWGQLMLALYRLGRQADALRAYQAVRHILAEELGVEPTPALSDLEARILQHHPDLMAGGQRPGSPPLPVRPRDLGDTVAFLFTDIESSTKAWEGDSEAMAADLARHDKILSEACQEWGGSVFSHTGDGLCAAFPTAAAALGAAVAGQSLLAAERWERNEQLRVRMAVHAGPAECRAGNYFGPTLNRVARLLACAWGGQIVCSAAGADLAVDQLPGQISLIDLGDQRLADLARPERVFQVAHPGLQTDFPPLRTSDAPRDNLPAALTSFIGRASEIEEIAGHLGRSRLVTLIGPGGAGKTRLSLEVARAVLDRFPDGAWLVELAPVRDVSVMGHEVAAALGFDLSALAGSGRPFTEALCEQLRHRRLLIVLDNCEHLVAAAADLTHAILTRCPGVVVLATSREVLAVAGEHVFRLGPLSLPAGEGTDDGALADSDAVTLFCERARESAAGFALTEANAAAVARICRRLDGIPLALELAAARIRLLGAQALADRLDDRFRLLAGGPRTADPRHQTLQAAVDWSHDLLSEPERIVLRRLAVFPSDFSLEAAEAVTAATDTMEGPEDFETLDILARLTDKSLLVATAAETSGVRYRLLETVRQYAAAKLADAGETEALRGRHRDFFSRSPGSIHEIADVQRLRWAQAEADNLRAALQWSREQNDEQAILRLAAPQGLYWMFSGTADGAQWLERAVAASGTGDVALRVQARCGLGMLLQEAGEESGSPSVALVREAVALADEGGDEGAATWARILLGDVLATHGQAEEAETHVNGALETFRARADRRGEGYAHALLGTFSLAGGDLAAARDHLEAGSALFGGDSDDYMVSHTAGMLALLDALAARAERATSKAAQGIGVARQLPGRQILVMALTRAAQAAVISGRIDEARESLDELLGLLRDLGARRWVADALELTAIVLAPARPETAARVLGAITALRGSLHEEGSFLPVLSERLAASAASVAASLGAAHAAEHEHRGATMHLDQILAHARAELRAVAVDVL